MSDITTLSRQSFIDQLISPPWRQIGLVTAILLPILVTLGQRLLAYVLVELGIN